MTQARLHHVLAAIGWAHWGDVFLRSFYEGDEGEGRYTLSNGEGDQVWVAWNAAGVVLLGFDHYSPTSQFVVPIPERDMSRVLVRVPAALRGLAADVERYSDALGTGAAWCAADGRAVERSGALPDCALPFLVSSKESLDHPVWGRRKFFGLSTAHARLAANLAVRGTGAPLVLTPEEVAVLRRSPPHENAHLAKDQWAHALTMMADLHIVPSPRQAKKKRTAARGR